MQIERLPSERNSRRLRVAAYIRVSTDKEEQDGSFEAQAEYYENWIRMAVIEEFKDKIYD